MRDNEEIDKLIKRLKELGFSDLNILFDSNPFILNLKIYEINDYIENRVNHGENVEDIVDELSANTYLFNEM